MKKEKETKQEKIQRLQAGQKNLIKWYEYTMQSDQDEEEALRELAESCMEENEEPSDLKEESWKGAGNPSDEDYEIDLDTVENLSEDDKDLINSIMDKFKDAKQSSVDSLFDTKPAPPSQEDLISSICAPRQNNVDSLVQQAREN